MISNSRSRDVEICRELAKVRVPSSVAPLCVTHPYKASRAHRGSDVGADLRSLLTTWVIKTTVGWPAQSLLARTRSELGRSGKIDKLERVTLRSSSCKRPSQSSETDEWWKQMQAEHNATSAHPDHSHGQ